MLDQKKQASEGRTGTRVKQAVSTMKILGDTHPESCRYELALV